MDPTVERPGAGASISSPTGDRKGDDARVLQLEAALVSRAQRGDRGAFEQLYRRHHGPVARMVAFSLGGGAEDAVVTFSSAGSSDPEGDSLTYTWDFGDGTPPVSTTSTIVSHPYLWGGAFTATLTVSDGKGGTASDTATATV